MTVLLIGAVPAVCLSQSFASSGWIDAALPRPAPESRYVAEPCPEGDGARSFRSQETRNRVFANCRERNWAELLKSRGHSELSASPGGRSYRYLVDRYNYGLGLKIVQLDVAPDGKATFIASYPRGRATARSLPADVVAEFEAALAKSRFSDAGAQRIDPASCEGDETVFEAVVSGRYKVVIEPCGDEAGLDKAMAVLDGQG